MTDEIVTSPEGEVADDGTTGNEGEVGTEVSTEPSFRQHIPEEFKDAEYWAAYP